MVLRFHCDISKIAVMICLIAIRYCNKLIVQNTHWISFQQAKVLSRLYTDAVYGVPTWIHICCWCDNVFYENSNISLFLSIHSISCLPLSIKDLNEFEPNHKSRLKHAPTTKGFRYLFSFSHLFFSSKRGLALNVVYDTHKIILVTIVRKACLLNCTYELGLTCTIIHDAYWDIRRDVVILRI